MPSKATSRPPGLLLVQAFSLGATSWLAGALASISIFAIPSLLTAPPNVCTRSFRVLYNIGSLTIPTTCTITTLGCIYVSRKLYLLEKDSAEDLSAEKQQQQQGSESESAGGAEWKSFAATAACLSSIPLFTFLIMNPTSQALLALAKEVSTTIGGPAEGGETGIQTAGALILRWGMLNTVRASLAVIGAAVGFWGSLR